IAAFDPRGAAALAGQELMLVALGAHSLSEADDELARLPLAAIDPVARLSLAGSINPAWAARIRELASTTVTPILGARDAIGPADVDAIARRLAPYSAWMDARPTTNVDMLDAAWIGKLAAPELRARLVEL